MPCCGVSMRILKVGAHWGVPSSGCSMPPRVESLPRVWLLQARAQLMGTSHLAFGLLPSLAALLRPVNALLLWPGAIKHWSTGQSGQAPAPVSEAHRSTDVH